MDEREIYLQEVKTQIRFALRAHQLFWDTRASGDVEQIFYHLHHFILHIAAVNELLRLKKGRVRSRVCASVDLSGIDLSSAKTMRNNLEHFDERLEKWLRENQGHAFFDMNIITGSRGYPHEHALRALDGDTLYFLGERYSIPDLLAAVEELWLRLQGQRLDTYQPRPKA